MNGSPSLFIKVVLFAVHDPPHPPTHQPQVIEQSRIKNQTNIKKFFKVVDQLEFNKNICKKICFPNMRGKDIFNRSANSAAFCALL